MKQLNPVGFTEFLMWCVMTALRGRIVGPSTVSVGRPKGACTSVYQSQRHLFCWVSWRGKGLKWESLVFDPYTFHSLQVINCSSTTTKQTKISMISSHICALSFPLAGSVSSTMSEWHPEVDACLIVLWRRPRASWKSSSGWLASYHFSTWQIYSTFFYTNSLENRRTWSLRSEA